MRIIIFQVDDRPVIQNHFDCLKFLIELCVAILNYGTQIGKKKVIYEMDMLFL